MPIKISAYKPHINSEGKINPGCIPYDTFFEDEMNKIKIGHYKVIINKCRSITDDNERRNFKATFIPSLTISSICHTWRKTSNIINHTGLLAFDIDEKDNNITDWPKLRDDIFKSDKVVCCFLSASGKGLCFIIKVLPGHHLDVFNSIEYDFFSKSNIKIDPVCKDLVRLRFVSYDIGLKIKSNIDEVPLTLPSTDYLERKKYRETSPQLPATGCNSWQNFKNGVTHAETERPFQSGKHFHLISLSSYCLCRGMDEDKLSRFIISYYGPLTDIGDKRLLQPVRNVYKAYKKDFNTVPLKAPLYTTGILRKLLKRIDKRLLKKYLYLFGNETFAGENNHTIQVSSTYVAFFMWLIVPKYTWSCVTGNEIWSNSECAEVIPEGCILDSCNGSRVWCKDGFPVEFNNK